MATAEIAGGDRIAFTNSSCLPATSLPSLLPSGAAATLYKASPRVSGANRTGAASLRIQVPSLLSSEKKDLERRQGTSVHWNMPVRPQEQAQKLRPWEYPPSFSHSLVM